MDKRKIISPISGSALVLWSINGIMGCLINISLKWMMSVHFLLFFIFTFGLIFWLSDYFTLKDVKYKYWKIVGIYLVPVLIISFSFGFLMIGLSKKISKRKKAILQEEINSTKLKLTDALHENYSLQMDNIQLHHEVNHWQNLYNDTNPKTTPRFANIVNRSSGSIMNIENTKFFTSGTAIDNSGKIGDIKSDVIEK